MVALSLTCATAFALPTPEIGRAPAVPPWPAGLPDPQEGQGGAYIPDALGTAIAERLLFLDEYPALCQNALDVQANVLRERTAAALEVERTRAQAATLGVESTEGWAWYEVAFAVGGGILAGALVGAGAVAVTR